MSTDSPFDQYYPMLCKNVCSTDYKMDCSLQELAVNDVRYLKYGCNYDNITWYQCSHDNSFYATQYIGGDQCSYNKFDRACPGDTHFYQNCGHGGCSGYQVTICFYLIP